MIHNKNKNPLLYLLIDCISVRSAPQILSIKDYYTFCFPSLLIGLFNSSANCWFDIFSLLSALFIKKVITIDRIPRWHRSCFILWQYETLYHVILYQKAANLDKSLKPS